MQIACLAIWNPIYVIFAIYSVHLWHLFSAQFVSAAEASAHQLERVPNWRKMWIQSSQRKPSHLCQEPSSIPFGREGFECMCNNYAHWYTDDWFCDSGCLCKTTSSYFLFLYSWVKNSFVSWFSGAALSL